MELLSTATEKIAKLLQFRVSGDVVRWIHYGYSRRSKPRKASGHLTGISMSLRVWIRGNACGVDNCRLRLYQRTDGRMRCQFGHFVEGQFEFDDEDDFTPGGVMTRRVRGLELTDLGRYTQSQRLQFTTDQRKEKLSFSQRVRLTLRCLQLILRRYVPLVIKLTGTESEATVITNNVKRIWIKYISESLRHNGCSKALLDQVFPDVLDLLAIIFVAMMLNGAGPLYIMDIIHWVRNYDIPTTQVIRMGWLDEASKEGLYIDRAHGDITKSALPIADKFQFRVYRVIRRAYGRGTLTVSASYFTPFLYRLVALLRLPPQLVDVYHTLYPQQQFDLYLSTETQFKPPETVIGVRVLHLAKYFVRQPSFDRDQWSAAYNRTRRQFRPMDTPDYDHPETWLRQRINGYLKSFIDKLADVYVGPEPSSHLRRLYGIFDYTQVTPDVSPDTDESAARVLSVSEIDAALFAECARFLCVTISRLETEVRHLDLAIAHTMNPPAPRRRRRRAKMPQNFDDVPTSVTMKTKRGRKRKLSDDNTDTSTAAPVKKKRDRKRKLPANPDKIPPPVEEVDDDGVVVISDD